MTILEKVEKDIPVAMRVKETLRLETLRSIKTELEIQRHKGVVLTADKEASVLKTMAKQRLESAEIYKKAGRMELAQKEEIECAIIRQYMPEQVTEEEMRDAVETVIVEMLAEGQPMNIKKMGEVMKRVGARLGAKAADGKFVAELVKSRL